MQLRFVSEVLNHIVLTGGMQMIECSLWPLNILTRPVGQKDRALLVHPKAAVDRAVIRRDKNHKLYITDKSGINIPDDTYIPEEKAQGCRHFFCHDGEGKYHIYGRRLNVNLSYTDIYPKILMKMPQPDIPPWTVIDFEMIWPGHPDSEVTTAIKECPEQLRMKCFALPIYRDNILIKEKSEAWMEGRRRLESIVGKENCTKYWKPLIIAGEKKQSILEALLNMAEQQHQEGYVLKVMACDGWWKLKSIKELDAVIIGFKISNADTRKGMVTALHIGLYDENGKIKSMGSCSGLNLELMNEITNNKEKYIGKVIRIIYQEIAGQGLLKHAYYDCIREDKNSESCTMEQL